MPKILTYNDKKTVLAAALKVREWNIEDISDTEVFYRMDEETGFRGTYKRAYVIGENLKVTLGNPVQVVKRTVYDEITVVGTFALDEPAEFSGESVILSGKTFEAGDYPDKNFSLTEEEMDAAITAFTPVDNNLEHRRTILDGALGKLESVSRKGKELFGKISIPKWLRDIHPDPIKVSLEWNRATKRIIGNGLVLNPRVTDAAMMAAFSAAKPTQGGPAMSVPEKKPTIWEKLKAAFSGGLPDKPEDCTPEQVQFLKGLEPEAAPAPTDPPAPAAPAAEPAKPEFAEDPEKTGLRAALLKTKAEAFFAEALAASKVFPAEREFLTAQFVQAAQDDNAGAACFSNDGTLNEGSRVKALRAGIAARPSHSLTQEQLKSEDLVLLSNSCGSGGGGVPETRKAELLKASGHKKKEG